MHFFILLSSFAAAVSAQSLLVYGDNALPTCARSCAALTNAQSACIPPAAPVTDDVTYESCFCQSGYLTTLKASGSTLCSDVCTDSSDVAQISTWYQSNCADNGVAAAASLSTATTATSTATNTATIASTVVSSASSSTGNSNSNASTSNAKPTGWWPDHWKWIVMVIVIFIGLVIFTVVLVLVRRRHHRRQDQARQPFNQGITNNSFPVVATVLTPPTASRTSLPRVREKDRMPVVHDPMPDIGEQWTIQGGDSHDIERSGNPGKLQKNN